MLTADGRFADDVDRFVISGDEDVHCAVLQGRQRPVMDRLPSGENKVRRCTSGQIVIHSFE